MPITRLPRQTVLALGAALLLTTAPAAFAQYSNDQSMPQSAAATPVADTNGITHITGGVGDDETAAIEAMRGEYNVHIINSNKDGAYNDSTEITITDKSGNEVVTADAGPLFFVQLPSGSYTVVAQHRESQQQKKIKVVKSKKAMPDIHFIW